MRTVLIVDDHPAFRRSARAVLEDDGFIVVGEAATGRDGIAAAASIRPDLVIVDVGLPDIDGFEVAETIDRSGGSTVILTSSRDAATYGPRLETSRAAGFVPKDELCGEVLRALAGNA